MCTLNTDTWTARDNIFVALVLSNLIRLQLFDDLRSKATGDEFPLRRHRVLLIGLQFDIFKVSFWLLIFLEVEDLLARTLVF